MNALVDVFFKIEHELSNIKNCVREIAGNISPKTIVNSIVCLVSEKFFGISDDESSVSSFFSLI